MINRPAVVCVCFNMAHVEAHWLREVFPLLDSWCYFMINMGAYLSLLTVLLLFLYFVRVVMCGWEAYEWIAFPKIECGISAHSCH